MGFMIKNRQLKSGDSGVVPPVGPSSTRPYAPVPGQIRYNDELCKFEYFTGAEYRIIATEGSTGLLVDKFVSDGSSAWLGPMTKNVARAEDIIVFVGQLYQIPNESYTVDGSDTIYFAEVVPPGINVNIIHNLGTTVTPGCV